MDMKWLERRRRAVVVGIAAAGVLAWGVAALHRHGSGGAAIGLEVAKADPITVEAWSDRFAARIAANDWPGLISDLDGIRGISPDLYAQYRLAYLHGRARVEAGEPDAG